MSDYKMLIDGELVSGSRSVNVINPATEQVIAQACAATEIEVNAGVVAAKNAFPDWAASSPESRKECVQRIADVLEDNVDDLANILTLEQGKPLADSVGEIQFAIYLLREMTRINIDVEVLAEGEGRRVEAHRSPLGVVAGIVPWNFPISLACFKIAPALMTGNTLVLKPAGSTPLTTLRFGELLKDVVPPGVLNIIADDNDLGALLCSHPDVAKISFTGSTATGSKVLLSAARDIKRVTLELGGNDAGIVLDDVDPKSVAPELFASAFQNCGQICIAIKRLFVQDAIYDALCDELAAIAKVKRVGNGLTEGTEIGPLQNRAQFEKVQAIIEDARFKGKIIAGGASPEGKGFFVEPTIVRDIEEGARLVDEEQFGPVLPVIRFSDIDEVVRRANSSQQGLAGSVWSSSWERAYEVAKRIETGTVWINKHTEVDAAIPLGGAKQSGLGAELGRAGVESYTQLKVVNIATC